MKRIIFFLFLMGLVPILGGDWAFAQLTVVKAGTTASMTDAAYYIALEKGYFAERGIKLELIDFPSAATMMAPLSSGELPVAAGAINAGTFNAAARGLPIKVVHSRAYAAVGYDNSFFLVRTDLRERFKTVGDFKGKKVALSGIGTASYYALGKNLEKLGISMKELDIVTMPFPDMRVAIRTKAVDAVLATEPTATAIREDGTGVRFLGNSEMVPHLQIAVTFYNQDWAEKNRKVAGEFMVAKLKGQREYYEAMRGGKNRAEVIAILARNLRVKDRALYEKMEWTFMDPNGTLNVESIIDQQEWYHKQGLVPRKAEIDKLVDESYVKYALDQLGVYPCDLCFRK